MLINPANSYLTNPESTTGGLKSHPVDSNKTSTAKEQTSAEIDKGDIALSSRSQKLAALSSEFFTGRDLSNLDINQLINRAHEYGLISQQQHDSLQQKNGTATAQDSNVASHKLVGFLQQFEQSEAVASADDDIKASLSNSKVMLANINQAKEDENFAQILQQSREALSRYINSTEFSQLSSSDQTGLKSVSAGLEIIDNISPKNLNNKQLKQYLSIANL